MSASTPTRPTAKPASGRAATQEPPVGEGRRGSRLWLLDLYKSALGKKYAMAISGIVLMVYVLLHMVGNLKIYLGAESMNHYGEWLRAFGAPAVPGSGVLWGVRVALILAFGFHIHAAWALTVMNRRARPQRYQSKRDYVAADFAARTMRWTGIIILLFVVFHLLDLTGGQVNPDFAEGMPYENTVASFSRPIVAIFYVIANLALGFHLYHGAWSLFQTMGWNRRGFNQWRRYFAVAFAVVVAGANISFPLAVMTGIVA
jgi:succinate dehydrogenase / fumarate reductase, cytochrome b subunit